MFKNLAVAALIGAVSAIDNEFSMHEVNIADLQTNAVQIKHLKKHKHHKHHNQGVRFAQENPFGRTHTERMVNSTLTYEPDLKVAIARQEAQEEAFKVPSVRNINAQKQTLAQHPDYRVYETEGTTVHPYRTNTPPKEGTYLPAGTPHWPDQPAGLMIPVAPSLAQHSAGPVSQHPYRTDTPPTEGTYPPAGTPHWPNQPEGLMVPVAPSLSQINPFGQAASPISGVFSYQYDPEVKAAVAKQEAQEEAFFVPSVKAVNGKGPGQKYGTI